MSIAVRILGPVSIDGPAEATSLSPKLRLVLAFLAAHRGAVVSADRLCDVLWGDEQPAASAATLQSHLSRLRRLLVPSGRIVALDKGYRLDLPDGALDLDQFARVVRQASETTDPAEAANLYQQALACWRGAAFGDAANVEWIRPEAVRLDELRLSAMEAAFECRLGAGGDTSLIGDLEAVTRSSPFRERFVRQLMVALYRDGRHADALRSASDFRKLVREQMGVDPSAALTSIESQILADDPALMRVPEVPATKPAVSRSQRSVVDGSTRLVGRSSDLVRIAEAVGSSRLVTLSGPGGVGKTRLARRIAATASGFADGVAFIELATMSVRDSLAEAVATALDVQPRQNLTMEQTLIATLADQRQLVVFDNCEHLLDALVPFVDRVRQMCPRVHVLTTSREPLGLPGELVMAVAPLTVGAADDADAQAASPAVELLLERIAAAVPGFSITADNAAIISEICRRLDGLPLALELVAPRFRSLPPETILQRIMVPSVVLGTSMRSANPRHRTLRDTVAWSFEQLSPHEQLVYIRLSGFAGSFDLAAAQSVCSASSDLDVDVDLVVEIVGMLVDKSMVQMVSDRPPRYQLLETLREYGREKLAEAGSVEQVEARHLEWFVDFAERASAGMAGPDEAAWSERLDRDFDNLRQAFGHAVRTGNADAALRLTASLREFAFRRIRYELASWAGTAVAMPGAATHHSYATVLAIVGYGHFVLGDIHESIDVAHRALAAAEELGVDTSGLPERTLANAWCYLGEIEEALYWIDRMTESARTGSLARLAHALYMYSVAETSVGRTVQGAILAGEASAIARISGSPTARAQAAYALGLGLEGSDPTQSLRLLREAAHLGKSANNRWIEAFADTEVWWLEARDGDLRNALTGSGVVIDTWQRGGDWANLQLSLRRVFGLLMQIGDHHVAAVLHSALRASGATSAFPFEPNDAHDATAAVDRLRQALGEQAFDNAVATGANLSDGELVRLVQTTIAAHNL